MRNYYNLFIFAHSFKKGFSGKLQGVCVKCVFLQNVLYVCFSVCFNSYFAAVMFNYTLNNCSFKHRNIETKDSFIFSHFYCGYQYLLGFVLQQLNPSPSSVFPYLDNLQMY